MKLNEQFNAPFALLAVFGLLLPVAAQYLALRYFEFLEWWDKL